MFKKLKKNSFHEIFKDVKNIKNSLACLVTLLRSQEISIFDEKLSIDTKFESLKSAGNDFFYLKAVHTTGDGNCFYNAVSICLFGNENFSLCLRLVVIFIFLENERYFRDLTTFSYGEEKFNKQIMNTSTNYNWANEYEIHATSIALNRAINVFSVNFNGKLVSSQQYCANDCQLKKKPISIGHQLNHFVALLPTELNIAFPCPTGNQFHKFPLKQFKFYN